MKLGYSIVDNQGSTTMFNPLQPLGPLASTYQSPLAAVDFAVHKNVTFKAAWNYYQYGEDSFVGPTAPRYFHANNTTLACNTRSDRAALLSRIRGMWPSHVFKSGRRAVGRQPDCCHEALMAWKRRAHRDPQERTSCTDAPGPRAISA